VLATSAAAIIAVSIIRPAVWSNYLAHPLGFIFVVAGLAALAGMFYFRSAHNDTNAFLASALFIAGMAASTAFGLYPNMLPASTNPEYSLTIYNTATSAYGLWVGLVWWTLGMILTAGYFIYLFHSFKGKVKLPAEGEGY
jgi:cytochrome d ubiquinol oxidase subunit II